MRPQRQHNHSLHNQEARYLMSQTALNKHKSMQVYNTMVKRETNDYLIYGDKGKPQKKILSNELGCLYQGKYFGVKGTYTINFIP